MGIFIRRPLALASIALCVGVCLGSLLSLRRTLVWIGAVLLACLILFPIRRKSRSACTLLLLVLVFFLAGSARSLLAARSVERLTADRIGEEVEVELYVLEERYASAGSSSFYVRLHGVDGTRTNHRALLKCDYALPLYAGDRFRATVRMEAFDYEDVIGQNRGDGIAAVLISESSDSLVYVSHTDSPLSFFRTLQDRLSYRVRRAIGGEEGSLIAAILLGADEYLSDRTVRDFRRTGASHLLAISGLHVAILIGFTDRVLLWCRVGKRKRLSVDLLLCLFYFLLTGCSYSLLRTLIMLGFAALSFMLSAEGDGITSLLFGGAMILLVSPHALFDLSFQMTVLATLGILAFAPLGEGISRRFPPRKGFRGVLHYLLRKLFSSLLITYSASVALLVIQWCTFGTLVTTAPLTNILLIPLATPLLILSLLSLPFLLWPAAAGAVGLLPALLAKAVL
ncbi:MAG: ComEC/Rec2 family competence protein [Clostridia bacterium]|nr:ComEC/Rec2 family competence protein [Clostridia bacterium]MBQ3482626.1 ComEC/Rec2 family competence protein [Clostridia bacterium]